MEQSFLGLNALQTIIAELRTPLLEVKLLSEAGDLKSAQEVSRQTLTFFDSFLYAQTLHSRQFENSPKRYLPYSLNVVTEDALQQIMPLARLYDIKLELKTCKRIYISCVREAFDHATHSLLHSLISSLQNKPGATLKIRITRQGQPRLKFLSSQISGLKLRGVSQSRVKALPDTSGLGSGLLLANVIYAWMGSKMKFIANQHGSGLGIDFKNSRQISLMEGLN